MLQERSSPISTSFNLFQSLFHLLSFIPTMKPPNQSRNTNLIINGPSISISDIISSGTTSKKGYIPLNISLAPNKLPISLPNHSLILNIKHMCMLYASIRSFSADTSCLLPFLKWTLPVLDLKRFFSPMAPDNTSCCFLSNQTIRHFPSLPVQRIKQSDTFHRFLSKQSNNPTLPVISNSNIPTLPVISKQFKQSDTSSRFQTFRSFFPIIKSKVFQRVKVLQAYKCNGSHKGFFLHP